MNTTTNNLSLAALNLATMTQAQAQHCYDTIVAARAQLKKHNLITAGEFAAIGSALMDNDLRRAADLAGLR